MRYLVLATDYDGTLAYDGVVDESTSAAIERFRASGGRALLVTGREIPDLRRVYSRLDLFERVVGENGGLLYDPSSGRERMLGPASDVRLVHAMRAQGVPLSVGRTIVATVEPYERVALEAIRTLGLELHVVFNKGAVMVLPSGVNKATGLCAALDELGLSAHDAVGIGDAENDHALFETCEFAVAVANAIPALRARADLVTTGARGDGVEELIERLLTGPDDVLAPRRHQLVIGTREGRDMTLDPFGQRLVVLDPSPASTSALVSTLLEELAVQRYQFCLVDPGGGYDGFTHAIRIGTPSSAPPVEEVVEALRRPDQNVIVSLAALPIGTRPTYVASLLPRLRQLIAVNGHPHWLVIDRADEALPVDGAGSDSAVAMGAWSSVALVTSRPDRLPSPMRRDVDGVVAVTEVIAEWASMFEGVAVSAVSERLVPGTARLWSRRGSAGGVTFAWRAPARR